MDFDNLNKQTLKIKVLAGLVTHVNPVHISYEKEK